MRRRRILWALLGAVLLAALLSLAPGLWRSLLQSVYSDNPLRQRQLLGGFESRQTLRIGIAGPLEDMAETTFFLQGVELAVDRCNEQGLLPLPLELTLADDQNTIAQVLTVAGELARDPQVVAVIGHWGSEFSMAAAQVYEQAGVLMLTPVSTNPLLTESGFQLVLRNAPTDYAIGDLLARYAWQQGFRRVSILYTPDMTGMQVTHAFESSANRLGLTVLDKRRMYYDLGRFDQDYSRWQQQQMDALLIADIITRNEQLRQRVLDKNPSLPILATDAYDYEQPLAQISRRANSLHVAALFNPQTQGESYRQFCDAFESLYHCRPDHWAVQGYDSVMLLAEAMARVGEPDARRMAQVLKSPDKPFVSVTGREITFNQRGDVVSPTLYVKQIINGQISYWGGQDDGR